ncbi:secreted protein [gut metagenome]|uniref:Secreted protein n=1 Tax=gut metagenome TaxID=749906 RepID=J9G3R8_9ZZZZ
MLISIKIKSWRFESCTNLIILILMFSIWSAALNFTMKL